MELDKIILLCLASSVQHDGDEMYVVGYISRSLHFLIRKVFTVLLYKCTMILHILFPVGGHLSCFQFLAIINKTPSILASLFMDISLWYRPRNETAVSWGRYIFNFIRSYQTVSRLVVSVYVLSGNAREFQLVHILGNI